MIVSDLLIWSAYFTIPVVIIQYISKKHDSRFMRLYFLFAGFILACGATHFLDATAFWWPLYRLNTLVKFLTGILSWITVYHLLKILPGAFSLRTFDELEAEIGQRKAAEERVRELNAGLERKVADQMAEIQATERKFTNIIENSSEAILLLDRQFDIIYSNAVAIGLTGRTEEERPRISWTALVHPNDLYGLQQTLVTVLGNDNSSCFATFRLINGEGHYIWLEGSFKNLFHDPSVAALVCNFRDVTERKKIEESLSLSEFIINSSNDAIVSKSLDGIITSWNKGAERIFGYSPAEAIGRHISMLVPADRIEHDQEVLCRIKQGEDVGHYETARVTKDGRHIFISQMVSPIRNGNGRIIGASKISRDITEEKIMKDKLVKSQKIYHLIAANIPGSIVTIVDTNRNYILAEGEGMSDFDYASDGLLGKNESEVMTVDEYQIIRSYRDKAFAGETLSEHFNIKSGDYFMRFIPLRDDQDSVYAVMTITLDVTDIKKAEHDIKMLNETLEKKVAERTAQLEAANKELEAFSYSVSHDLRAPLRIINGYADILSSEYEHGLDNEGKRILDVIMTNTQQMGILIDALLNLSRMGRKDLVVRNVDMTTIVRHIADDGTAQFTGKLIFPVGDLHPAYCDDVLIKHVWNNLISNAVKYSAMHESPVIEIGSLKKENEIVFWVKDNGVGFDMKYIHKLFGVFQRLHKKTEFEGTGVGLALVQRIIFKHGGNVWAEAEEGNGATFFFSLPVKNH